MNKSKSSEGQQQALLFRWAEYAKAKYLCLQYMYHTPNGGSRNEKEAANLKRQGVKRGVPDVCLPYPCGGYHGLYIEMKFGKNKPTKEQTEYLKYLSSVGYKTAVCYDWEEARSVILTYLEGLDKKHYTNLKLWGG
ncbi:MAG: VRR-NUC domain-containing protein [Clostridia bacterium]|nr:VRR-NUC domain-containing protein [Clostridia bacterium]